MSLAGIIALSAQFDTGLPGRATELIIASPAAATPLAAVSLPQYIEAVAKDEGVDPRLARRIAFCESTYRQFDRTGEVLRGKFNSLDVGVFQINEKFHLKKSRELGYNIYSTEGNAQYAVWLIKNQGTKHWKSSRSCWVG